MTPIVEGGDVVEPLRDRVLGRIVAETCSCRATTRIRSSPATPCSTKPGCRSSKTPACRRSRCARPSPATRFGVCAHCYGRDLARGHLVNIGEAVGVIAAQSIGEPGTQLTMRTFHIGGAASRAAAIDNVTVKTTGSVKFNNLKHVNHANGHLVAVSRSGELSVLDNHGRERERYKLPYGAMINVKDGGEVKAGQTVANWDPHTHPDRLGSGGFHALHRLRRRRDRDREDRRTDRPRLARDHRSEASRHPGQGPASDWSASSTRART
jgi:DNA-directed RNA polymerase subunit beta'